MRTVCQLLVAAAIVGAVALGAVLVAPPAHSSVDAPRRVVFLAIAGHGTVTSVPQGIACPKKCRVLFNKDALVRLVAHPAAGWVLASWSGSCDGRLSTCAFNLTQLARLRRADVHDRCVRRARDVRPPRELDLQVIFVRLSA